MLLEFVATVLAAPVCAYLLPGVHAASNEASLTAGVTLAVMYLLLRGPLRFLTKPLGCITFGLIGTVADALLVMLCDWWMEGAFVVDSFSWAIAAALVVNVVQGLIHMIFDKNKGGRRK